MGAAFAADDWDRGVGESDVLGPGFGVAGEGEPVVLVGGDGKGEGAALSVGLKSEGTGPERKDLIAIAESRRKMGVLGFIPCGPVFPVIEKLGKGLRLRRRNRQEGGEDRQEEQGRFHGERV